jgi:hypothetical protein
MADFRIETISVQGCRTDHVPATIGLRSIWTDIEYLLPDTSFYNLVYAVEISPGVALEQVYAALRALVARHDSLRSHFFRDAEGTLVQRVCAGGEIIVDVCDARAGRDDDLYALVTQLEERIKTHRFDHEADLPIRVGIAVLDGMARGVMLCVSHAASDFGGLQVLGRELQRLARGDRLEVPATQPADVAAWEHSPQGARAQERALRHWRQELQAMPTRLLAEKDGRPEDPRYPIICLRSKAVALAVDVLSARCRASSSAVLLAATALLLGQAAEEPRVTMLLISANRTRPLLREFVGNLVQDVPVGIDLTQADFATMVRSAFSASVHAYRNTHCERAETERMRQAESAARGAALETDYYFNDVRPFTGVVTDARTATPEEVRAALAESRIEVRDGVELDSLLGFLRVTGLGEDEGVLLTLRADSLRLSSPEMADFLLRMEALLLAAVERGVDTAPQRLLEESALALPAL